MKNSEITTAPETVETLNDGIAQQTTAPVQTENGEAPNLAPENENNFDAAKYAIQTSYAKYTEVCASVGIEPIYEIGQFLPAQFVRIANAVKFLAEIPNKRARRLFHPLPVELLTVGTGFRLIPTSEVTYLATEKGTGEVIVFAEKFNQKDRLFSVDPITQKTNNTLAKATNCVFEILNPEAISEIVESLETERTAYFTDRQNNVKTARNNSGALPEVNCNILDLQAGELFKHNKNGSTVYKVTRPFDSLGMFAGFLSSTGNVENKASVKNLKRDAPQTEYDLAKAYKEVLSTSEGSFETLQEVYELGVWKLTDETEIANAAEIFAKLESEKTPNEPTV